MNEQFEGFARRSVYFPLFRDYKARSRQWWPKERLLEDLSSKSDKKCFNNTIPSVLFFISYSSNGLWMSCFLCSVEGLSLTLKVPIYLILILPASDSGSPVGSFGRATLLCFTISFAG